MSSANEIDPSEYAVEPGHAMMSADAMGLHEDAALLLENKQLQKMVENDPRFSAEALQRRVDQRREKEEREDAERAANAASSSSASVSSAAASVATKTTTAGAQLPDVLAFGFCKLVFDFLNALKTRFYRRTMIAKTYELFWQLAEKAPSMSYDKFRDVVFLVGQTRIEVMKANAAQNSPTKADSKLLKRVSKLAAKSADGDVNAQDALRKIYGEETISLFEARIKRRAALPASETEVAAEDKAALFRDYEAPVLKQVVKIPLFRLAKLDTLWCEALDLNTRDTIWQYVQRLCKVTALIDNFDPDMKKMINSVSLDSLNSMKNKKKGDVDVNALLEELQARVMDDDAFLDKVSEIASKQM